MNDIVCYKRDGTKHLVSLETIVKGRYPYYDLIRKGEVAPLIICLRCVLKRRGCDDMMTRADLCLGDEYSI